MLLLVGRAPRINPIFVVLVLLDFTKQIRIPVLDVELVKLEQEKLLVVFLNLIVYVPTMFVFVQMVILSQVNFVQHIMLKFVLHVQVRIIYQVTNVSYATRTVALGSTKLLHVLSQLILYVNKIYVLVRMEMLLLVGRAPRITLIVVVLVLLDFTKQIRIPVLDVELVELEPLKLPLVFYRLIVLVKPMYVTVLTVLLQLIK